MSDINNNNLNLINNFKGQLNINDSTNLAKLRLSQSLNNYRRNYYKFFINLMDLPIISSNQEIIYKDRFDENKRWYLPSIALINPSKSGVLAEYWKVKEGPGEDGELISIYNGQLVFKYKEFKSSLVQRAFQQELDKNEQLYLSAIPFNLQEAKLIIYALDEKGKERSIPLIGRIDIEKKEIVFDLEMKYFKTTYYNLAAIGDYSKEPTLKLYIDYTAWILKDNKFFNNPFFFRTKYPSSKFFTDYQKKNQPSYIPFTIGKSTIHKIDRSKTANGKEEETPYIKKQITKTRSFPLAFPCESYGDYYTFRTKEGTNRIIGCNPQWEQEEDSNLFKKVWELEGEDFPVSIYKSLVQPQTYLLIPKRYIIFRDLASLAPAVSLVSALNPENETENYLSFSFVITPDITEYQEFQIRKKIASVFNPQDLSRINILFPGSLEKPPKLELSDAQLEHISNYGSDNFNFFVDINTSDIITAKTIIEKIKNDSISLGINGSITFDLENEIEPQSSLLLNLNNTIGEVLLIEQELIEGNLVLQIKNACESLVELQGLVLYNLENNYFEYINFNDKINLESNQSTTVKRENLHQTKVDIIPQFEIIEHSSELLSERRIHVDLIHTDLVFTTNVNPEIRKIEKIVIETTLRGSNQQYKGQITPENDSFENRSFVATFSYPLDKYLMGKDRVVNYKVSIQFLDTSVAVFEDSWKLNNQGNMINLSGKILDGILYN